MVDMSSLFVPPILSFALAHAAHDAIRRCVAGHAVPLSRVERLLLDVVRHLTRSGASAREIRDALTDIGESLAMISESPEIRADFRDMTERVVATTIAQSIAR